MTNGNWTRRGLVLAGAALLAPASLRGAHADQAGDGAIEQPAARDDDAFIARAFAMQRSASDSGDQAYGAVVVRDGRIVGQAPSRVVTAGDPTAHAEMEAIRDAARRLGSRSLSGCILYSSSRACPMCEAAAYWAGIDGMKYGRGARDAGRPSLC